MDPIKKAEWISALRSGNYEQGQRYLKREGDEGRSKYCCLGVLRELVQPGCDLYENEQSSVLNENHACGLSEDQQRSLARMNDFGDSFLTIASYIETNI